MAQCGLFFALSSGIRVRTCDTNWNKLKTLSYVVPPYPEQQRITDFLDVKCAEVDCILEKTRTSIEEYKKLKQAVISEAITQSTSRQLKIKYCVKLSTQKAENKDGYIGLENIESFSGRYIHKEEVIPEGEAVSIKKDDVLFGKLRPYLAKSYLVETDGCCSGEFLVLKAKSIIPQYLKYVLLEAGLIDRINMSTYGTKMPRANWAFIGNQLIPFPQKDEQQEIAANLDEKCAAIDSLIAAKEALITELEAYKKSIIYEYVTGKKEVPAV